MTTNPAILERAYCDATDGETTLSLRCDLPPGHTSVRHVELWVASWLDGGTDVRWYRGNGRNGRPVYRPDAVS